MPTIFYDNILCFLAIRLVEFITLSTGAELNFRPLKKIMWAIPGYSHKKLA